MTKKQLKKLINKNNGESVVISVENESEYNALNNMIGELGIIKLSTPYNIAKNNSNICSDNNQLCIRIFNGISCTYTDKEYYIKKGFKIIPFNKDETIVIYRKGNDVIALDKATGKKATATCSPDDEFDFETGAKLAFERLFKPKVREVARNAKKGEYVKIVDARPLITNGKPEYKNGDILLIKKIDNLGARYGEKLGQYLDSCEYVVSEGYEPPKEKKDDSIRVGDEVRVVDKGTCYTTSVHFFERNGLKEELKRYAYGFPPKNGDIGVVLAIKENRAVIKCDTGHYLDMANFLIDLKGLERV